VGKVITWELRCVLMPGNAVLGRGTLAASVSEQRKSFHR
jgi:hypothetical protein